MIFQIFLIAFSFLTILRSWRQYRRQRVSRSWFFIWSSLWLVVLFACASPKTLDLFALWVGVGRGADLFVYLSILILFTFVFRLLQKVNHLEKDLTRLVRALACQHSKDPPLIKHISD